MSLTSLVAMQRKLQQQQLGNYVQLVLSQLTSEKEMLLRSKNGKDEGIDCAFEV